MAGGKATPKKDKGVKVTGGQSVKTGTILARGLSSYKAGTNVAGRATLYALCDGGVHFSRKKTSHGKVRTYINILAGNKKTKPEK